MSRSARDPGTGQPPAFASFPRQEWGHRRTHHWLLVVLCAAAGALSISAGAIISYRVHTIELCLVPDGSASPGAMDSRLGDDAVVVDFATTLVARAESWSPATLSMVATQTRAAIHPSARLAWEQTYAQHRHEGLSIPTAQMAEPVSSIILKRTDVSATSASSVTVAVAYLLHQFLVVQDPPGWSYVRTQTWVMTVDIVGIVPDDDGQNGMAALLPQRQSADDYLHDGGSQFWSAPP